MKETAQQLLFNEIRSKSGSNASLVNEISEILGISIDSAYRRLRGEKLLSLDELTLLVTHFSISLDALLHIQSGTLLFNYVTLNQENPQYLAFLENVYNDVNSLSRLPELDVIISAKDFPVFYNFYIPEIAAFKSFFWKKSIIQIPEFKQLKFDPEKLIEEELNLGQKIAINFSRIPTRQLWNEEVFSSLLNQINYFNDSGFMLNKNSALHLLNKTLELVDHFQNMAEMGAHFLPGKEILVADSFRLYQNDVIFGDNTIIVNSPNLKRVIYTHNVIDTLYSHDSTFFDNSLRTHENILNRSVLLSKASERERHRFFKKIRDKVEHSINSL
jgi:hypothetical protein